MKNLHNKHLEIFPMADLVQAMEGYGFEQSAARRQIASVLTEKLGCEVKITPKFHECFNFASDVLLGRMTPDIKLHARVMHDTSFDHPVKLYRDIFLSMEPAQIGSLLAIEPQVLFADEVSIWSSSIICNYVAANLTKIKPQSYPYKDLNNPKTLEVIRLIFVELVQAWEAR